MQLVGKPCGTYALPTDLYMLVLSGHLSTSCAVRVTRRMTSFDLVFEASICSHNNMLKQCFTSASGGIAML